MSLGPFFLVLGFLFAPVGHATLFGCSRFLLDIYQQVRERHIPPSLRGIKNDSRLRWNYDFDVAHQGSVLEYDPEMELLSGMEVYYTPGHIVLKRINEVSLDYLLAGSLRSHFDVEIRAKSFRLSTKGANRLSAERELFARIEKDYKFLYDLEASRLKKLYPLALRPLLNLDHWDSSRRRDAVSEAGRSWTHDQAQEVFDFLFAFQNFDALPWIREIYDFRKSWPLAYRPFSKVEYLDLDNNLLNAYAALRSFDLKHRLDWSEIVRHRWLSNTDFLIHSQAKMLRMFAETELSIGSRMSSFLHLRPLVFMRSEIFYTSAPLIPLALSRLRELPREALAEQKTLLRHLLATALEGSMKIGSPMMLKIFDTAEEMALGAFHDAPLATLIEHLKQHWTIVNLAERAQIIAMSHPGVFVGSVSLSRLVLVLRREPNHSYSVQIVDQKKQPAPLRSHLSRYDYYLILQNWPSHQKKLVIGNLASFLEKAGDVSDLVAELDERRF